MGKEDIPGEIPEISSAPNQPHLAASREAGGGRRQGGGVLRIGWRVAGGLVSLTSALREAWVSDMKRPWRRCCRVSSGTTQLFFTEQPHRLGKTGLSDGDLSRAGAGRGPEPIGEVHFHCVRVCVCFFFFFAMKRNSSLPKASYYYYFFTLPGNCLEFHPPMKLHLPLLSCGHPELQKG